MPAVTVLCAPRDEALAQRIAAALSRHGYAPRRPAGAFHEGAVPLDDDAAIVVWSNAALRIARLHSQARQALARGRLVPVAVGGAIPPGEFEALPPVDLSGWGGDEDDPRWRFVLEEIEIARLRQKQAADPETPAAPPLEQISPPVAEAVPAAPRSPAPRAADAARHPYRSWVQRPEPRVETPVRQADDRPIAAPKRRKRRRSRLGPYVAAVACGTALAAVTGAAVFLTPAPDGAAGEAGAGPGVLAFVEPGSDAGRPPEPQVEETPSGYEVTVTRELERVSPGELEAAAAGNIAADGVDGEGAAQAQEDEAALAEAETEETGVTIPDLEAIAQSPSEETGVTVPDLEALARAGSEGAGAGASASSENAASEPDVDAMDRLVAEVSLETPYEEEADGAAPAQGDIDGYFRDCDVCPPMARIPAGSFAMGSPPSELARHESEGPQREMTIPREFAMAAHEVTFDEWEACVADGGCAGYQPYAHGWGRQSRPVINVSFEDARLYAQWLSQKTGQTYRLPTEAEWEYAARAGGEGPFAFEGPLTPEKANYNAKYPYGGEAAETRGMTTPAESFQPNAFGLYDMHGNVWEWTADCWAGSLADAPADAVSSSSECARRALRGGAWNSGGWRLRSAHRIGKDQTAREFDNGFRVVRELN